MFLSCSLVKRESRVRRRAEDLLGIFCNFLDLLLFCRGFEERKATNANARCSQEGACSLQPLLPKLPLLPSLHFALP
jgi:hypothetical protein